VDYIDLYVIDHTWTCKGDIAGAWRQVEEIQQMGYARSIGLSASVVSLR
jgi:diketogulonate reductase-like aldo/keto reductase